ncbi:MAG TPA: hypothetical protein VKG82_05050 [Solirubrobacteraceae bacterium]|nr:hypothetical protein [Solirubrobacteraceae bacterium]
MSLSLALAANMIAGLALVGLLALAMTLPSRLRPHAASVSSAPAQPVSGVPTAPVAAAPDGEGLPRRRQDAQRPRATSAPLSSAA